MPRLTETQMKILAKREEKKNEALSKKMEAQRKKELYGENWKKTEHDKIQQDYEFEIGSDKLPKIYDSKDVYDFIEPIQAYKDRDNKPLNMDYNEFIDSELEYEKAIDKLNAELEKFGKTKDVTGDCNSDSGSSDDWKKNFIDQDEVSVNVIDFPNKGSKNKTQVQIKLKEKAQRDENLLKQDGVNDSDDTMPIVNTENVKGIEEEVVAKAKMYSPIAIAKHNTHFLISGWFNRFVPLYNKHVCTCCGKPSNIEDFYINYDVTNADRVDKNGNLHIKICKTCTQKLFMYYYEKVCSKNAELTMQLVCASLNLYWDIDFFDLAMKNFEDSERKGTVIGEYIKIINKERPGRVFMDSPFLDEKYEKKVYAGNGEGNGDLSAASNDTGSTLNWTKEDYQNKKDVIRIVGYDPFATIKEEATRKALYKDFCQLIDEDLAQDYVKVLSAITIVRSFLKVRQLDEKMIQMDEENAPLKEQKDVSDLKKKELDSITAFCASNGWSERFKTKVGKGETSFTGIMKQMYDKKYEDVQANRFDIATSASMQLAADFSMNAIMKQLSLSDAEVWKITQDQYQVIMQLRKERDKLEEDLRKARYEAAEAKLMCKAAGIKKEDL